jgi:hypothetical protein
MAIKITRGTSDPGLDQFIAALEKFQADHPDADISVYRYGKYLVRVRIVDPGFAGQSRSQRHRLAWPYFESLPEETLSDLSSLLLLTPDEVSKSFANSEFDDPIPAVL